VACCRVRETENGLKLERFAVILPYRNRGIGAELLNYVLKQIDHTKKIYLNAQIQVEDFYSKYGFKRSSDVFEEANIDHVQMTLVQ
jgi:predicted GNAT family N-acyltransferase